MGDESFADIVKKFGNLRTWKYKNIRSVIGPRKILVEKPFVRDVSFKYKYSLKFRPRKLTGYLVQSRGMENPTPCSYCQNGDGPFSNTACISVNDNDLCIFDGTCGNCIWSGRNAEQCFSNAEETSGMENDYEDDDSSQDATPAPTVNPCSSNARKTSEMDSDYEGDDLSQDATSALWTRVGPCWVETDRLDDLFSIADEFLGFVYAWKKEPTSGTMRS